MKKIRYRKKYAIFLWVKDKETGKISLKSYSNITHTSRGIWRDNLATIYCKESYNRDKILQEVKKALAKDTVYNLYYEGGEPFWVRITNTEVKLRDGILHLYWDKQKKTPNNKVLWKFERYENEEETKEN